MNDKVYEFDAVILEITDIDKFYIEFSYDLMEEFSKGKD